MENYEPNDFVYVQDIGFCQLVSCGRHRTLKLKKKEDSASSAIEPVLRKQKQSICFEPDSYMFGTDANIPVSEVDVEPPLSEPTIQESKKPQPNSTITECKQQPAEEDSNEPNIVTVKLAKTNFMVYTPDFKMTKTITLKIKTFFGARQQIDVSMSISSTILQLKNRIIELSKQPPTNLDNTRLISSANGLLTEYANPKQFLYATKLKQNSKLIFLATIKFTFNPSAKGPTMNLTNSNKTVAKQASEGGYQICLGNTTMYCGKHYFETKIDKMTEEEDIIIGVAKKSSKLATQNIIEEPVWGYLCLAGKKLGSEVDSPEYIKDYGPCCKVNDIVGTLIQLNANSKCTLSFYVNGKFIGGAFKDIEGPVCPCVCLGSSANMQVSINTSAEVPFELSNYGC